MISELENVEGVGKKTAAKLLKHFKGVTKIREASLDEVAEVVGKDRAEKLKHYFDTIEQCLKSKAAGKPLIMELFRQFHPYKLHGNKPHKKRATFQPLFFYD